MTGRFNSCQSKPDARKPFASQMILVISLLGTQKRDGTVSIEDKIFIESFVGISDNGPLESGSGSSAGFGISHVMMKESLRRSLDVSPKCHAIA